MRNRVHVHVSISVVIRETRQEPSSSRQQALSSQRQSFMSNVIFNKYLYSVFISVYVFPLIFF